MRSISFLDQSPISYLIRFGALSHHRLSVSKIAICFPIFTRISKLLFCTILNLLKSLGISFLPSLAVQESLTSGVLREVTVEGVTFRREIGVAWRQGRYFGPAIRHLLDAIFEQYGEGRKQPWVNTGEHR